MSLPAIDYLDWIEGRPESVEHDLGSSDLRGAAARDPDVVVPERLAGLPDPGPNPDPDPDGVTVREAVAATYEVSPGNVLVTAGASPANAVAAAAALDEADPAPDAAASTAEDYLAFEDGFDPSGSVLVEKPAYEPLVDTPQLFGARVDRFLRRASADWRLDPEQIEAALVDDTALVTVTNRHNPTGRLTARETLAEAAAVAGAHDARLLVDEVYAPYVLPADGDDAEHAFGGVTAAGLDGVVVTGSLTKFHGLGGLGVGWLIADEAFVERAERVGRHFPSLPGPSRALGRRALANREALERDSRDLLGRNADLLATFVEGRADLAGPVYEGSSYALLTHERADGDAVAETALDRDLLVVPGRFFETPDRFRVSLGRDGVHVREALDVLGGVCDDL
ncbi:pyridoxal phosphate-dependent aminotransferase [Halobacteriales archaeon SW_5_70_135]|nr:MAG: pyridoxal phosphate-dependent aminotransferase [Halobacteriales archaeon SW_5_70_135]